MIRILILLLTFSFLTQVDAQHIKKTSVIVDSEYNELPLYEFTQTNVLSYRNDLQLDSSYTFEIEPDNLVRKRFYSNYNEVGEYGLREDYVSDGSSWVVAAIVTQEFNSQGNPILTIKQSYENGLLVNDLKLEADYDSDGNELLNIVYNWDATSETWVPSYKYEFSYDADDLPLTFNVYRPHWMQDTLALYQETTYTNVNGVRTERMTTIYAESGDHHSKTEYYLNSNNEIDSTYHHYLNNVDMTWYISGKSIYYREEGSFRSESWRLLHETGIWDPSHKTIHTYFSDIDKLQFWEEYQSDINSPDYRFNRGIENFYSDKSADVNNNGETELSLDVPNPFLQSDQFSISGITDKIPTTFSLTDMSGITRIQVVLDEDNQLQLNNQLANGIYIASLSQNGKVQVSMKILKVE